MHVAASQWVEEVMDTKIIAQGPPGAANSVEFEWKFEEEAKKPKKAVETKTELRLKWIFRYKHTHTEVCICVGYKHELYTFLHTYI